ncbi:MAG: response regulator [Thermomicrobiales bacterium]
MAAKLTRIFLVDQYGIVREGVRCLRAQEADLMITGEAASGAQALRLLTRFSQHNLRDGLPDVVITERDLPDMAGPTFVRQVKTICPTARVLILTWHDDEDSFHTLIEHGADGYVLKQATPQDLVAAIHALTRGDGYLAPAGARRLLTVVRHDQQPSSPPSLLSAREQEILELLARGATSQQIAQRLGVSLTIVENHRVHLLEKLHASNTVAAIVSARRAGLLTGPLSSGYQPGLLTEHQPGDR